MVLEIADFAITAGSEDAFLGALGEGLPLISGSPGCRSTRVTRGIETPTRFVLLVEWDSVQAHLDFRDSDSFPRWRGLVGPHFASPPSVEHVADV